MATVTITTTPEEQQQVLEVLKDIDGTTVAMSSIANLSGLSISRVRYAIADLIEAGKIRKIPTKCINPHYIRYKYEVI